MDLGLIIGLAIFFFLLGFLVGYLVFTNSRALPPDKAQKEASQTGQFSAESTEESLAQIYMDRNTGRLMLKTPRGIQELSASLPAAHLQANPESAEITAGQTQQQIPQSANAKAALQSSGVQNAEPKNTGQSSKLIESLSGIWRPRQPARTKTEKQGIALQIDLVLQEQLSDSLVHRGLRLVQMPDQSMGIVLDRTTYDSIDSVPEEEVRNLIRAAVSEWSRRQSQ